MVGNDILFLKFYNPCVAISVQILFFSVLRVTDLINFCVSLPVKLILFFYPFWSRYIVSVIGEKIKAWFKSVYM